MIFLVFPDIPTEDRLLAQARQGSKEAMMTIYETYFPPIYQFIRLRVVDSTLAEDLASDVFVKLVEALQGRTAPKVSLRGWLFKVARNLVYKHYGKTRQFPTTTLEEWLPASSYDNPEVEFMRMLSAERARSAIQQLSPDQQEVLALRFGQVLSLEETAAVMDKTVGAVKQLQFRAVNTLRTILKQMGMETANG